LEHDPGQQHQDVEHQQQIGEAGDQPYDLHGYGAKGVASGSACATAPSPDTAMFSGESRKTLLVTRSIRPNSPSDRPLAKSTRRRASASLICDRLMMTGMPSRNASAMPCASRYCLGCTVRISVTAPTAGCRTTAGRCSGVTGAVFSMVFSTVFSRRGAGAADDCSS